MTITALGLPAVLRRDGQMDETVPVDGPLIDRYGRIAKDLRVSLTDRCNLRCSYCMPAEGLDWLPGPDQLTDEELVRLLRIATGRGP